MKQALSDQALVKLAQQGELKAFDLLVKKYQGKINLLVARYISDPVEALDVTQEAFIKAYRGLSSFRGDSAFYTWLYRIAINAAKNHLVSRQHRAQESEVDVDEEVQAAINPMFRDVDTPEHLILSEEIRQVIMKSIDDLPEDLRTAITLREMEGLSYEEIAKVMDCPIGTVRSRIFRAREAIDQNIKPLLED